VFGLRPVAGTGRITVDFTSLRRVDFKGFPSMFDRMTGRYKQRLTVSPFFGLRSGDISGEPQVRNTYNIFGQTADVAYAPNSGSWCGHARPTLSATTGRQSDH
jgi:hypothetical protein